MMEMQRILDRGLLVAILGLFSVGCLSVGPEYMVSPGVEDKIGHVERIELTGEHCGWNILFVQLVYPSTSAAIQDALARAPKEIQIREPLAVRKLEIEYKTYLMLFPWQFVGPFGGCVSVKMTI